MLGCQSEKIMKKCYLQTIYIAVTTAKTSDYINSKKISFFCCKEAFRGV